MSNNDTVTDALNKCNSRDKTKSISCFDFSTFYKKIVYGKLIKVCNQLIDCYCKGGYREFISANGKWSFMGKKRMPKVLVFPNSTGKKFVKYLP